MSQFCTLIVYSSGDELWKSFVLDELQRGPLQFETWTDEVDEEAASSQKQIPRDMRAVLLLLTPAFFSSVPIREQLLPKLADFAEDGLEVVFLWLEGPCWKTIEDFVPGRLISARGRPLDLASEGERSEALDELRQLFGNVASSNGDLKLMLEVDKQALYKKLFDQHYRGVFYFFARRGFDTEDCRDLAQETFLKVYRGLDSYRSEAAFGTWIRAIMRNLWLNSIRDAGASKRQASEVSLEHAFGNAQVPERQSLLRRQQRPDPEERFLDAELRSRLRAAVRELPPQARRCQLLRLEGLKYREIAAVLGISIQAVRSHLFQARKRLEQILGRTAGLVKER